MSGCDACASDASLPFSFGFAFQPIVDSRADAPDIHAHEALVRGVSGEPAESVLSRVTPDLLHGFDQASRVAAVQAAAAMPLPAMLSINFQPTAVVEPALCLRSTLRAMQQHDIDPARVIFEVSEHGDRCDSRQLGRILAYYRAEGFLTAIDDFGAGQSGLLRLVELQPDYLKLDRSLVQGVAHDPARQSVLRHTVSMGADIGCTLVAEGVEALDDARWLHAAGIFLQQGYLYAQAVFGALPDVSEALLSEVRAPA